MSTYSADHPYPYWLIGANCIYSLIITESSLRRYLKLIKGFKDKQQTDVIYTDFSKAYESVNHLLLLNKLVLIGFPNNLLFLISNYLSNRTQKVIFKNSISKPVKVTSGVPQGSHLGPL